MEIEEEKESDRLLTPGEVFSLLVVPPSSGWALLAHDCIPRPIRLGRRTRWSRRARKRRIEDRRQFAQSENHALEREQV